MSRWRQAGIVAAAGGGAVLAVSLSGQTQAEIVTRPFLSFYGTPGLIDMPSASMQPDASFSGTAGVRDDGGWRTALTFQATPRLSTTFQYSFTEGILTSRDDGSEGRDNYDRAFGFSYRFLDEGRYVPEMAIGITDVAGTGFFGSEYIVATKHVRPDLAFSAGIGWGRLGSYGSFGSPFGERPDKDGQVDSRDSGVNSENWFRGPAAFFGGVDWQINDRWSFVAEYSSDGYVNEVANGVFERNTPYNFGLNWRPSRWFDLGVYSLYGSEVGLRGTITLNPKEPPFPGGREEAPPPVSVPGGGAVDLAAWGLPSQPLERGSRSQLDAAVAAGFDDQGLQLVAMEIQGATARVTLRNTRYDAVPQAIGRASRVLAAVLPERVRRFEITPLNTELPTATITIRRADLVALEANPERNWKSYVRARIEDADGGLSFDGLVPSAYPNTSVRLKPYLSASLFDPDNPLRADFGAELNLAYAPAPGIILSGRYRQKIVGNRDESTRLSDSVLPRVRSDLPLYDQNGSSYLSHLTAEHFSRPGPELYGRVTAGYLERMYAGVSGEMLWKPVTSPIAYGLEINQVQQRDFEGGFGLRDYTVTTGHASLYYDMGNGFYGQVDAGRYLAGDWGGTFTVSRDFANGWRVGAFATFTDVSAEDFGEGSFDKGIFFNIPFAWLSGEPSRNGFATTIRPLTRDGGARLQVRNRLYDVVKDYQDPTLERRWGKFWR